MPKISLRASAYDQAVSDRIRAARLASGWSQERLADTIGVTFQQVQKYEKGSNRVSAGRLMQIAEALGQKVSSFFPDASEAMITPQAPAFSGADVDTLQRLATMNPKAKQALQALIRQLSTSAAA